MSEKQTTIPKYDWQEALEEAAWWGVFVGRYNRVPEDQELKEFMVAIKAKQDEREEREKSE